jgi:hypothetical protein
MFTAHERLRRHDRHPFFTVNDAFKPNVVPQQLIRPVQKQGTGTLSGSLSAAPAFLEVERRAGRKPGFVDCG